MFDALTHDRVYKKAWAIEQAVAYINEQRGRQFDPKIVDAFLDILETFLAIRLEFKD